MGYVLMALFFGSALLAMGRAGLVDGFVWLAALCSPAVMLGVERGSSDLLMFSLVIWAVLLLQSERRSARLVAHALFLLAAVLKLYPVFAWGPVLRQPRRWAIAGAGALTAIFGAYAVATRHDLQRTRETVPRQESFAYGAPILGGEVGGPLVLLAVCFASAVLLAVLMRRRVTNIESNTASTARRDLDLFVAGAGVFVGTFAIMHSFNYRMVFLLLTLPQLLRWAREPGPPLPLAAVGVAAVIATLWLGTSLPVIPLGFGEWWGRVSTEFPYDELLNVALFAYLGAGLLLVVAGRWGATLRASTIARG
jgi:hypothetical protein